MAYHDAFEASIVGLNLVGRAGKNLLPTGPFPEQKREVLWLRDPILLAPIDVHAVVVVQNVLSALPTYLQQDYTIAIEPFTVNVGTYAIIQDTSGIRLCILEQTRTSRTSRLPEAEVLAAHVVISRRRRRAVWIPITHHQRTHGKSRTPCSLGA